MKLNKLISITALCLALAGTTACKDDPSYAPITLDYETESLTGMDGNTLTISPFSTGVDFRIDGGDGNYVITNNSEEQLDYRYDGNTLTVIPKKLGNGSLTVADRSGNSFTLQVTVAYPEETLNIESVSASISGGSLTLEQVNKLQNDIQAASLVQAGGKYIFTYTNKEQTEGQVAVYPDAESNALHGIFSKDDPQPGTTGVNLHITLVGDEIYDFLLQTETTGGRTEVIAPRILKQDVTDTYKGIYTNLEKAYCIQHIPEELR